MDDEIKKSLDNLIDKLGNYASNLNQFVQNQSQTSSSATNNLKDFSRTMSDEAEKSKQRSKQIENLWRQIKPSMDDYEVNLRGINKEKEKEIETLNSYLTTRDRTTKATQAYFKELGFVTDATKAWSAVLNADADGIGLASKIVGTGLSVVGKSATALGDVFGVLALAITTNPIARILMGAAALLSKFVGTSTDKLKDINDILAEQVKKTINSFRTISSAGVAFQNGMTGFRDMSFQAGLTMGEFSKVVKNNAETIAQSGLGINDGSKMLANSMEAMRNQFTTVNGITFSLREQMLNLGFGIEEQGELVTETMAQIRRAGGNPQDAIDVANRTAEYAKNLRIISQVTGEDAKKKMKEAQDVANDLAFNAKIREQARAKFGDDQAKINEYVSNMTQNMATLPKELQDAVKQQVLFGTAIGDTAVALAATPQDLQDSVRNFANGIINIEDDFKGLSTGVNDALVAFRNTPGEVARAISTATSAGFLSGPGGILQGIFGEAVKRQEDGINKAIELVEMATKPMDGMTTNLNQVSEDMRDLQMAVENLTTSALGKYSRVLNEATNATKDLLEWYKKNFNEDGSERKTTSNTSSNVAEQLASMKGTARGYANEGLGYVPYKKPGEKEIPSSGGYVPYKKPGEKEIPSSGAVANATQIEVGSHADGGEMKKDKPAIVGERGPELVVPAQNSMVIPNHFNLEPVVQSMHEQNRIGNEMLRYMKNMVDAQEKLVRAT